MAATYHPVSSKYKKAHRFRWAINPGYAIALAAAALRAGSFVVAFCHAVAHTSLAFLATAVVLMTAPAAVLLAPASFEAFLEAGPVVIPAVLFDALVFEATGPFEAGFLFVFALAFFVVVALALFLVATAALFAGSLITTGCDAIVIAGPVLA